VTIGPVVPPRIDYGRAVGMEPAAARWFALPMERKIAVMSIVSRREGHLARRGRPDHAPAARSIA
jgi:hypothetical protein